MRRPAAVPNYFKQVSSYGLTLVEVLVSMTIGILLIFVLLEMYLISQRSVKLQTAMIDIQDNAYAATAILTSEIQKAGTIGCGQLTEDFPVMSYLSYTINPKNKMIGNASNEITVRYADYPNAVLNQSMTDNITLETSQHVHFSSGDVLIISNCQRAELFTVQQVKIKGAHQELIALSPLHHKYEKYSEISRFVVNTYYVAPTNRRNQDGTIIYALFVKDIKQRKSELVENINKMKITYSFMQAEKLEEVSADKISDWSKVVGVGIDLEVRADSLKKNKYMYSVSGIR
ncbi:MAG: hypothetical protein KF702_05810 [Gammaproteobacteria bacterium]|nr:hypothetical protein [Gammaproteobacteria bacterium]